MDLGTVPMEWGIAPMRQGDYSGERASCGVCVGLCLRVCTSAYCVVHANLRGGARGGGLYGGPSHLYCLLGMMGGSLGQVEGQPGVGLIMACLLETMTY